MGRTYAVLEDRESFTWVEKRLDAWPGPSGEDPRYPDVVAFLSALVHGRSLPDIVFVDDAVPVGDGDRRPGAYAAAAASAVRRLATARREEQPRIVAVTATAVRGEDLLAMFELGADDVVLKADVAPDAQEAFHESIWDAVDDRHPRSHARQALKIAAHNWPPAEQWPADMEARIQPTVLQLLPLLPLWEAGIVDEEFVNRHLSVTEQEIRPDMRGLNRRYTQQAERQAKHLGWLSGRFKDHKRPLRGTLVDGARADGLLWVSETTRSVARDLPWPTILETSQLSASDFATHAPFASNTDANLAKTLYKLPHDPRAKNGGAWIYRYRLT